MANNDKRLRVVGAPDAGANMNGQKRQPRRGDGEPPSIDMEIEKRLTAVETILPTLATKADLDIGMAKIRADVADIRVDIHKAITENARWTHTATIGMFTAFVLGVLGLLFTIWNATKQPKESGPAPSQPPIIINIPAPAAVPAQVPPPK